MSSQGEELVRLAHDVGKYICRTAINIQIDRPIPDVLLPMIEKDLYSVDGKQSASVVFAQRMELVSGVSSKDAEVVRGWLSEIDSLEDGVRAGDQEAVRRACTLALRVRDEINRWVKEEREGNA